MSGFQFKQFFVAHDRCAMKVGTDGVLLGATATLPHLSPEEREHLPVGGIRVLDVGTGTGLVALMIAQKIAALSPDKDATWQIDAIDIDPDAVSQSADNFAQSPWASHLHTYASALQDWQITPVEKTENRLYNLIVSNPPYFVDSLKNPDAQRQTARHTDTLSYEELIYHSRRLLAEEGRIQLILPIEAEGEILRIASEHDLTAEQILYIRTTSKKSPKRVIVTLRRGKSLKVQEFKGSRGQEFKSSTLTLMGPNGEPRSREYAELCREYYL